LAKRRSLGKGPPLLIKNYLAMMVGHITIRDLEPTSPGHADVGSVAKIIRRQGVRSKSKPGETVATPNRGSVLFVERGRVDVFLPTLPERTLITSLDAGAMFGDMPLLGMRTLGADLVAAKDCLVLTVPQDLISAVIDRSPATAFRLMAKVADLFDEWGALLLARSGVVRPGLIRLLLRLAAGRGYVTGVSQQEMADLLGVNRTTIWRCMERLRREGLVDWTRMKIVLHDPERMRRVQWVSDSVAGPDAGE
jgi:CRP-like cAMP-binding protein